MEKDTEDGKYYITDNLVNDRGFGETEPEPPVDLIEMPSHTSYAMPQIYVDAKTNLKITGDWQYKAPNLQVLSEFGNQSIRYDTVLFSDKRGRWGRGKTGYSPDAG